MWEKKSKASQKIKNKKSNQIHFHKTDFVEQEFFAVENKTWPTYRWKRVMNAWTLKKKLTFLFKHLQLLNFEEKNRWP